MKRNVTLIGILSLFVLTACNGSSLSSPKEAEKESSSIVSTSSSTGTLSSSSHSEISSNEPIVTGTDIPANGEQTSFFKNASNVSISLKFSDKALYDLSRYGGNTSRYKHKYDDLYFPATFTAIVGNTTYKYFDVGVRMKGATSRREIASSDGTISNSCHLKINFKATFDDALYDLDLFSCYKHEWTDAEKTIRKDRRFFGLEKLDLKYLPRNEGATNGETYSQEIYSYDMFREHGVESPYARWVDFNLSSDHETKSFHYEAIEPIDKRFLKYHFNDNKGDLYKCTQVLSDEPSYNPLSTTKYADLSLNGAVKTNTYDSNGYANGERVAKGLIGVEDNYNNYHPVYSLKTNDDAGEGSDFSKMANLINVCYSLRYKKAPYSLLDQTIDVEEWLNFAAISFLLGNYDDMRNNGNNFYIYFRKSDNKAVFIPYDYDYSLGLTKTDQNYSIMTTKSIYTTTISHNRTNSNNLYYATILSNSSLSYYGVAPEGGKSQEELRVSYSDYVDAARVNVLDFSNYESSISAYPNSLTNEVKEKGLVRRYMQDKKNIFSVNGN
ncbi:MAG: CotH kinase family protein [Bacilli bacterium]|nr:CotH kinase family protein [Bacilli bacterium]